MTREEALEQARKLLYGRTQIVGAIAGALLAVQTRTARRCAEEGDPMPEPQLWKECEPGAEGRRPSYCPHCEDWHSGICGDIPKDEPLVGIDTEWPEGKC